MGIYIVLFTFATLIFIGFIFYEKHRLDKLPFSIYKIISIEDDIENKNLIKVLVQSNDKEPAKLAVIGRNKKYFIGNNIVLYSKTRNGKVVLVAKSNFKMIFLQLFLIWLACIIMLILTYFGSEY